MNLKSKRMAIAGVSVLVGGTVGFGAWASSRGVSASSLDVPPGFVVTHSDPDPVSAAAFPISPCAPSATD